MIAGREAAIRQRFDRLARLYCQTAAQASREQFRTHLHSLDWTAVRTALDVACGPAALAVLVAERAERVFALDVAAEMLHQGRQVCRRECRSNVVFVQGTADALPFTDGAADLVTCGFVFPALAQPQRALAEMRRVLRPGGRALLLDVVAPEDPSAAVCLSEVETLHQGVPAEIFPPSRFQAMFRTAGLRLADCQLWKTAVRFADWAALGEMLPGSSRREEARRRIQALARSHPALFGPREERDELVFHYPVALFVLDNSLHK